MERLFLVKQYFWKELEQEDVVRYLLQFYVPLFNEVIEQILIQRLLQDSCRCSKILGETLGNKHMILDPRLRNDRLAQLLLHLEKAGYSIPYTKKVGQFFLRAYHYDNSLLMRLLKIHNFLYSVPPELMRLLLQQFHTELMSFPTWSQFSYQKAVDHIILYCLEQRLEEPVLEWMTFGKYVKGFDLVGQTIRSQYINESEKYFYQKLCIKQESPEMKEKRKNVLLYKQYKD